MRSTQRRKEILDILKGQGGISVGEIAERFGVSKMTGHRDLEHLERRGMVKRIFGGAVPGAGLVSPQSTPSRSEGLSAQTCTICLRPPAANLLYTLTLDNGEQRLACCPHCGISAQLVLRDHVAMALCVDYLTGQSHPAREAQFLMGSLATPCCHPSLLTFADQDVARRFQAGFGGTLGGMTEAMAYLQEAMSIGGSCPHCSPGSAG